MDHYLGEIRLVGFDYDTPGWARCDGQELQIASYPELFAVIGTTFGGNGTTTFALPDLRGRVPRGASNTIPPGASSGLPLGTAGGVEEVALTSAQMPAHNHEARVSRVATSSDPTGNVWAEWSDTPFSPESPNAALSSEAILSTGEGQPHTNLPPYTAVNYIISLYGVVPTMYVEPYLGEVRLFAFDAAPQGWEFCEGQRLSISQNQALFALLGTLYGGDGVVNFELPDLRGRTPISASERHAVGASGGATAHTLSIAELPPHTHEAVAGGPATTTSPHGAFWANPGKHGYGPDPDASLSSPSIGTAGGSQPHENLSPYRALRYAIAVEGVFPSQT